MYAARTNVGVTELLAGSGVYGVEVGDLTGKTVVWDIDGTTKGSSETFYSADLDVSAIDWTELWDTMPTGTNVNVISPVYLNGDIEIIRGDDYATPDNRELTWTDSSSIWPDLSGATLALSIYRKGVVELTVYSVSYSGGVLTAQLFSSDTSDLTPGTSYFDVQATLSSGRKATLVMGRVTIVRDYT